MTKIYYWIHCALIRAALASCFIVVASNALAQDQTTSGRLFYENRFGDIAERALRSIDRDDNVIVARQLIEAAEQTPDSEAFQTICYTNAVKLSEAVLHAETFIVALTALEELSDEEGEAGKVSDTTIATVRGFYRRARGDTKAEVAQYFVQLLRRKSSASRSDGDLQMAYRESREASSICSTYQLAITKLVEKELSLIVAEIDIERDFERLQSLADRNPNNSRMIDELFILTTMYKRDYETASLLADRTSSPELSATLIEIEQNGLDNQELEDINMAAEWMASIGLRHDNAIIQRAALLKASRYFQEFLSLYGKQDIVAFAAKSKADEVNEMLVSLSVQEAGDFGIDLIENLVVGDYPIWNGARVDRQSKSIILGSRGGFVVPLTPEHDYLLRIDFTYEEGEDGLIINLPLSQRQSLLQISRWEHTRSAIQSTTENTVDPEAVFVKGKQSSLVIEVQGMGSDTISIAVALDNTEILFWSGKESEISVQEISRLPAEYGNVIAIRSGGRCVIRQCILEYRD